MEATITTWSLPVIEDGAWSYGEPLSANSLPPRYSRMSVSADDTLSVLARHSMFTLLFFETAHLFTVIAKNGHCGDAGRLSEFSSNGVGGRFRRIQRTITSQQNADFYHHPTRSVHV